MKPETSARLRKQVVEELDKAGVLWSYLVDRADEIILFGSRATGLSDQKSDWDLLLVSDTPDHSFKVKGFDLIWVTPEQTNNEHWLGSEIANHIAAYGVVLHGSEDWFQSVFVSQQSIEAKKSKIEKSAQLLLKVSGKLESIFVERRIDAIRRDLQRLRVMSDGIAVPPTATIEYEWDSTSDKRELLASLITQSGISNIGGLVSLASSYHMLGGKS